MTNPERNKAGSAGGWLAIRFIGWTTVHWLTTDSFTADGRFREESAGIFAPPRASSPFS